MSAPTPRERSRRAFAGEVVATAILQLVSKLRGLILLPVIARAGDAELFGVWAQLTGLVSLLAPLFGLNLHQSLMRYAPPLGASPARALFVRLTTVAVGTSALFAGILSATELMFPAAGTFLAGVENQGLALQLTLVQIPGFVAGRMTVSYLRSRQWTRSAQIIDLVQALILTLVAAMVFSAGGSLAAAQGWASAALGLYTGLALGGALLIRDKLAARTEDPAPDFRAQLAFALPFFPGAISDWVLYLGTRYVVGYFHDASAVGHFAAAFAVGQLLLMFSYPFEYVLLPTLSRHWDTGGRDEVLRLGRASLLVAWVALLPTGVLLSAHGPAILSHLTTQKMGNQASDLIAPVAIGMAALALTRIVLIFLYVAKRGPTVARLVSVSAAVTLTASFALVPSLGARGAAVATAIGYSIFLLLAVYAARDVARGFWQPAKLALVSAFGVSAFALPLLVLPPLSISAAIVVSAVGLAVYIPLLLLSRVVDPQLLRSLLRRNRQSSGAG